MVLNADDVSYVESGQALSRIGQADDNREASGNRFPGGGPMHLTGGGRNQPARTDGCFGESSAACPRTQLACSVDD
jgi:hypothetical protein